MYSSVAEVIDAIGGSTLSRRLGHQSASTVSSWKQRGSIPPEYWPEVISEAQSRGVDGVSADTLAEIHARQKGRLVEAPAAETAQ